MRNHEILKQNLRKYIKVCQKLRYCSKFEKASLQKYKSYFAFLLWFYLFTRNILFKISYGSGFPVIILSITCIAEIFEFEKCYQGCGIRRGIFFCHVPGNPIIIFLPHFLDGLDCLRIWFGFNVAKERIISSQSKQKIFCVVVIILGCIPQLWTICTWKIIPLCIPNHQNKGEGFK